MKEQTKLLSVIILTYNEESNLPNCLVSLNGLNADIYVIDSGSTDKTVAIANAFGAKVVEHSFESQSQQLNWALENLSITTPWCLRLDADEYLLPELRNELLDVLSVTKSNVGGFLIKRRVYFNNKWIRFGGYYPTWLFRLWRTGKAYCENKWMDEHMIASEGHIEKLKNDFCDNNHKGMKFWIQKHDQYAEREVLDILSAQMHDEHDNGLLGQAKRKRWLKNNVYFRSPMFIRAFFYWVYRYFLRGGFLDGTSGLIFHFYQAFWYRFLVDVKLYKALKLRS